MATHETGYEHEHEHEHEDEDDQHRDRHYERENEDEGRGVDDMRNIEDGYGSQLSGAGDKKRGGTKAKDGLKGKIAPLGDELSTHDEHEHEHEHDHDHAYQNRNPNQQSRKLAPSGISDHSNSRPSLSTPDEGADHDSDHSPSHPEKKIGKATELQDQTNLLPTKQVILVFVGLTFSLFGSLLDQTM
jgi:hypothetical protein